MTGEKDAPADHIVDANKMVEPDHIPEAGRMVDSPAGMPDGLVCKVIEIVEGAVNSAIPEPWEVTARASAAILSLFARILAEKEAWAERGWSAYRIAHDQAMENGAAAQTARAALAAERGRCAVIADAEASRQPNSQFYTHHELGAAQAARRIAAAIRAEGE